MNDKEISIKDIAKMAGVSVATVSRVIHQNGRFSKETEDRVNEIIKEFNYQPNQLASGLRVGKSKVVGIVVPDITNEFFSKITLSLQLELLKKGYLTIICNTNMDRDLEKQQLELLSAQQVSGLVYVASYKGVEVVMNIPTVYMDQQPSVEPKSSYVVIKSDNQQGSELAAAELIKKGCKKIAVITFEADKASSHIERAASFVAFAERYGIETTVKKLGYTEDSNNQAFLDKFINEIADIDGIFCTTDYVAFDILRRLQARQIPVPEKVKLIGFDGILMGQYSRPSLTTIQQPMDKIGVLGAEAIITLIEGDKEVSTYQMVPVSLVIRETT